MPNCMYLRSFGKAGKSELFVTVQGWTRCGSTDGELADEKTAGLALNVGTDNWARTLVIPIPVCTDCLTALLNENKEVKNA